MFDPKIHHRRSIRLRDFDYSNSGAYFITIDCEKMRHRFGEVINGKMVLNDLGIIAFNEWINLNIRFTNMTNEIFQIMPNHMHGIILLDLDLKECSGSKLKLSEIIGAYKSIVSNKCLKVFKAKNELMSQLWKRNYFEHVIRNEISHFKIADYIMQNPANWNKYKDDLIDLTTFY